MRTSTIGTTRNTKLARFSTAGLTVLGTAALATTAFSGAAHAQAPAGPAEKPVSAHSASSAQHVGAQAAALKKAAKADAHTSKAKGSSDNLDGWIREARSIMQKHGIPGSYDGIKRNIIRESAGDPNAMNGWDVNAKKGTPSKGLLQVIQPTFDQYHVKGTADKLTDPVANIVAACNYAADRYGSMDKVDSAY
ncbi:transglycosylase SLT domain-containing protein [Streptomyces sp. NBC_01187]|uniref:transglycosylase SLT domain-containing protein n=1 Tax=Streptomyces sp. NBC_01187 TaxID=2903766 RepID=UPI003869DB62|nr:transglycosylase SLT domain-containing protein [Streptomyces sp. NBC_01187]